MKVRLGGPVLDYMCKNLHPVVLNMWPICHTFIIQNIDNSTIDNSKSGYNGNLRSVTSRPVAMVISS